MNLVVIYQVRFVKNAKADCGFEWYGAAKNGPKIFVGVFEFAGAGGGGVISFPR